MGIKLFASIAAIALLMNPLVAISAGRRTISAKTAQQGFRIPVSSQGVVVTIPGQQITYIQLSHLSQFVYSTDNGNMALSGSGTANLIHIRRVKLNQPMPGELRSPDGSAVLYLTTNGGACASVCNITLVPSSAVPSFNIVEIGVDPPQSPKPFNIARKFTPQQTIPVPSAQLPPVQIDLTDIKTIEEFAPPPVETPVPQVEQAPVKVKVKKVKVPKVKKQAENINPAMPLTQPVVEVAQAKTVAPKPVPIKAKPKVAAIPQVKTSGVAPRVLANQIVMGLAIANRSKEIPYYSPTSLRVQDLVRILRRNRPLDKAIKQSGVSQKQVNRLLQLGAKK